MTYETVPRIYLPYLSTCVYLGMYLSHKVIHVTRVLAALENSVAEVPWSYYLTPPISVITFSHLAISRPAQYVNKYLPLRHEISITVRDCSS